MDQVFPATKDDKKGELIMVTLDKSSIGSPALTRPMHFDATFRNSPTRIAANSSNSDDTTRSPGSMAAAKGHVSVAQIRSCTWDPPAARLVIEVDLL